MHKDKPPGWFEFGARSARHAVWMGLIAGLLLSFLVHATLVIARADAGNARRGMDAAKGAIDARP